MATLCLQEEEMLAEKVQGFPVLYDKRVKGFKEKDAVQNAFAFAFALITSLHEDIAEKRRNQTEKKEEKSGEELFCSSLAAELKELPEDERCMSKSELQNVLLYQMMVLNR